MRNRQDDFVEEAEKASADERRRRERNNLPEDESSNFESRVSDINTDRDAGFDFDLNPTDDINTEGSER